LNSGMLILEIFEIIERFFLTFHDNLSILLP